MARTLKIYKKKKIRLSSKIIQFGPLKKKKMGLMTKMCLISTFNYNIHTHIFYI